MKTSKNRISLTITMKLQVVSTFEKFKLWKFLITKFKLLLGWSTFHVQNLSESFLSAGTNLLLSSVWCYLINDPFHKLEAQRLALYPILSNLYFYSVYHYLSRVELKRVGRNEHAHSPQVLECFNRFITGMDRSIVHDKSWICAFFVVILDAYIYVFYEFSKGFRVNWMVRSHYSFYFIFAECQNKAHGLRIGVNWQQSWYSSSAPISKIRSRHIYMKLFDKYEHKSLLF